MGTNYKIGVSFDARNAARTASELKNVDNALNNFGRGGLGDIIGGNLAADAIQSLTATALAGGKAILDYSSRMEQTKIGFETLMGGAVNANKHLEQLKKFAVETPFEFESLTGASRRLQNVGLAAEKVIPLMRDIGNAAAAAGASSEELDSITLAFSQIIAKGKLSAEEVNQLAERGIPVWEMLSKTLGKSKGEIIKLAEAGKITSDVFLEVFQSYSQAKFGDAMQRQSRTFAGAMSTIKDIALQTGEELFKPVFDEVSKFAVDFSQKLQSQEVAAQDAASKFGYATGFALGQAYKRGVVDSRSTSQAIPLMGGGGVNELIKLLAPSTGAVLAGFTDAATAKVTSLADLRKLDDTVGKISSDVFKLPSVSKKLELADADKSAKALNETIGDLTSRVAFFGLEGEVYSTKQRLINQGVTDFNSALARNALSLASQLDKLKAAERAQTEYNRGLETASDYLEDVAKNARFEVSFPDATELDKFEEWARTTGDNFKELQFQILSTRSALQSAALIKSLKDLTNVNASEMARVATVIDSELNPSLSTLDSELRNVSSSLGLSGIIDAFGTDVTASAFSARVQGFIAAYEEASKYISDENKEALERIKKSFKAFLTTFRKDGFPIIGDKEEADRWVNYFIELKKAVNATSLKKGLADVDQVLSDLGLTIAGFGAKTELEKFDQWLADPQITAAIEERAKAIGMTADALKELLRQQKAGQEANSTRPRVVGATTEPGGFGGGLMGEIGVSKVESEAERASAAYERLGQIAGQTINDLAQGMGSLVENWVLYGNASGMSARKAIASALAMAASQSAVSAIMETAYGIAALTPWGAAIYGPAPLHFKSAALFATIAAGAALAGRAVAGDSFNQGNGASGNAAGPDYQTVGSAAPNVRQTIASPTTRRDSQMAVQVTALAEAVNGLNDKISGMSPGSVVVAGAKEKRGFISEQVIGELRSNGSKATDLGKALRLA